MRCLWCLFCLDVLVVCSRACFGVALAWCRWCCVCSCVVVCCARRCCFEAGYVLVYFLLRVCVVALVCGRCLLCGLRSGDLVSCTIVVVLGRVRVLSVAVTVFVSVSLLRVLC